MNDLNLNASGLAIFGTNAGLLLFVTNATDTDTAYAEYAEEVGFDTGEHPISSVRFRAISASEMPEWVDADATDHPDA